MSTFLSWLWITCGVVGAFVVVRLLVRALIPEDEPPPKVVVPPDADWQGARAGWGRRPTPRIECDARSWEAFQKQFVVDPPDGEFVGHVFNDLSNPYGIPVYVDEDPTPHWTMWGVDGEIHQRIGRQS